MLRKEINAGFQTKTVRKSHEKRQNFENFPIFTIFVLFCQNIDRRRGLEC